MNLLPFILNIMKRSYTRLVLFLILSLTLLSSICTSLSAIPFFQINNKYIETGSYTVSTASLYGNTSANAIVQWDFTNTLSRGHSAHYAISSITRFNFHLNGLSEFNMTTFVYSWSSTVLYSCLQSRQFSSLYALAIRYLVLDGPYVNKATDIFTGIYYIQNYTTKPFSSLASQNPTFGSYVVNLTGGTKAYAFFNGINATGTSNNQFDLTLTASYPFPGGFRVTLASATTTTINLGAVMMTLIGFNVVQAATWPFPAMRVDQGVFSPSNSFLDTTSTFLSYNTFYGVTGFGFTGQSILDWNSASTFSTSTSISASSAYPINHLEWLAIAFWVKQCKSPTIYYMISNDTCYDICPYYYFQNSTSMLCQSCTAYDCLKCNSTQLCTLCDNVTAFRVLNTSTGRCDPLPGYYETGLVIAPPCDTNCRTCTTTSTFCLSCYPGFYLSSNICYPCSANCNNCSSAANCTNCTSPYSVDVLTFTCIINCSLAVGNCTNCILNSGIACTACVLGFFLDTDANICSASCGDGVLAPTQLCDDGNLVDGDGCSSSCIIEQSHYCIGSLGDLSICSKCSSNCLNCSSDTNCTLCDSLTILDANTKSCIPNCSVVTNCQTCIIDAGIVVCQGCTLGYVVNSSNMCDTVCGDGIMVGAETCDDNNTVDGDGCSSVCTIETSFYCTGTPSLCQPCSTYCSACSSATNCSLCNILAILDTTNTSCSANCTIVASCSTCIIENVNLASQFLQCTNCTSGFSLDYTANICNTICGDGLILGNETCDDGNTNNGDGCSSTCIIEPAFYCNGTPSICAACLQYCYQCTTATDCLSCNAITIWDAINNVCFANCSVINYCLTCDVSTSSNGDYIQCLNCSGGYSVDLSSNQCMPICGDGIVALEQQCDDGNLNNGDGCSSICLVQTYFTCNTTTANISSCQLTRLTLTLLSILKDDGRNSATMYLEPIPSSLPIYKNIDWSSIITTPNNSLTITSVNYDPVKDQIVVNFDYSSTIQDSSLQLQIDTSSDPNLSGVTPFNLSLQAVSSDNQALVYYQETDYTLAKVDGYLSLGLGAVAFAFLLAGTFAGRLVGLECSAVIQMAYISILTLQNLSPGFKKLKMLYLCFGYNRLRSYDYSQSIERPFKSAEFDKLLVYNYNVMGLLVFAPLIGALVCKLVARKKEKQQQNVWGNYVKYCVGQYMLYVLLSFCYLANLSLFIQLKYMESSTFDYLGVGVGVLVLATLTFYLFFYAQADTFFTEFKDKFNNDGFSRRFYILPIIERVVSPSILTIAVAKGYGNAPIIGINALMAVIILIKSPYKGDQKNYRPFTNYVIAMIIQGIYFGVGFSKNPQGFLSLYGPLVVIILLLVSVIYSAYALAKQFKQKIQSCNQSSDDQQELEMKEFTAKFFKEENNSLLMNRNLLPSNLELTSQLSKRSANQLSNAGEIPAKGLNELSNLTKIRTQLNEMKSNTANQGIMQTTGYNQSFKELMANLEDEI